MSHRALAVACVVAAVLLGACAHGGRGAAAGREAPAAWTSRAFVVPGHGRLLLRLPPGWTATEPEGAPAGRAIRLERPGARVLALFTPLADPQEPGAAAGADTARLFAELGRRRALAGSVEAELPLEELSGPDVTGYYFSATDRALAGREAGPDEYRHVLQGAAAVGAVVLAFTLLDDGPGPWRAEVLEVTRTARHVPDGEAAGGEAAALEPLPDAETTPLRVALPGKTWALLVDLPGFAVARVAAARAVAGGVHVLGRSPGTDVVASVLLAPAGDARDAGGCRASALARVRARVGDLAGLRTAEGGGAAAASYVVPVGAAGAPERHAHAFRWREGVCASVHVSKIAPGPEDAARLDAVLSSVRIAEDL